MKKKVHIIAHTHWDREWYIPFERHNMLLVELFDDLLEIFENDPEFHSFHLDGQTLLLEDYLKVRPEKRDVLKHYIEMAKLKIGPFLILQDAFLTSSESNVRNALIGFADSYKWGKPTEIGYFPDTFGLPGQLPQLMRQMNFDNAFYGRGVKPQGVRRKGAVQGLQESGEKASAEANQVAGSRYVSKYSEMNWTGVDGTSILGILFANWYSNGNEIPVDKEESKEFWDAKIEDAENFASTRHLLMMNGCDHQPLQKDLTQAIHIARSLYPDVEFVHTDLETYLAEVKQELPEDLSTVFGELRSQETDGWHTLVNCASSRIYLKQWNTKVSRQLENIAEPLATMAYYKQEGYPHAQLNYAWKRYMENHPHDSICGCSIDGVHDGMMTRFKDAYEVGRYIEDEAKAHLAEQIDTSCFPEGSWPFIIFNTSGSKKTDVAEIEIEIDRISFSETWPTDAYERSKEKGFPHFKVIDSNGEDVTFEALKTEVRFGYDLPKDKFRQPYMGRFVTVKVPVVEMDEMSWHSYALVESSNEVRQEKHATDVVENEYLTVKAEQNGTLTVTDKETGEVYKDLLVFENVGDIGNEYIFTPSGDRTAILSTNFKTEISEITTSKIGSEATLTTKMMIPVSAEASFLEEQMAMVELRKRQSKRDQKLVPLEIKTKVSLERGSRQLKFVSSFDNKAKDHRLRVLFPTDTQTKTHQADSIFETAVRPNGVSASWTYPENPQHQHTFVNVYDNKRDVTVFNYGLNEYELIEDRNTLAITILRATGELGDWGYFPTPGAQVQGEQEVEFAITFHDSSELSRLKTYHDANAYQIPFTTIQTAVKKGELLSDYQFLKICGDAFKLTAFKQSEDGAGIVTRGYNLTDKKQAFSMEVTDLKSSRVNLLEEITGEKESQTLKAHEIVTHLSKAMSPCQHHKSFSGLMWCRN